MLHIDIVRQMAETRQSVCAVQSAHTAAVSAQAAGGTSAISERPVSTAAAQFTATGAQSGKAQAMPSEMQQAERAAADAAAQYEVAQERAREAFAPEEAEVKSLVEMMKEAKERADEQRERFKLPKNTRYGDAPMEAYARLAKAKTQAQVSSAAGYARSKIAQLQSQARQDLDNAPRIQAAIRSLQKAVNRAGRKKRELQQERLTDVQRQKAAMRKQKQKAQHLRRELMHRKTMRSIRENGYLRECDVDNRLQDQLQASRMELQLQMQQMTASFMPSPEMAAQQYAMQAGLTGFNAGASGPSVEIEA